MSGEQWTVIITAVLAVFGGGGIWQWLSSRTKTESADRAAASTEYRQFVEDLQKERRDREAAFDELEKRLKTNEDHVRLQALDILALELWGARMVDALERAGIEVPAKPQRRTANGQDVFRNAPPTAD